MQFKLLHRGCEARRNHLDFALSNRQQQNRAEAVVVRDHSEVCLGSDLVAVTVAPSTTAPAESLTVLQTVASDHWAGSTEAGYK